MYLSRIRSAWSRPISSTAASNSAIRLSLDQERGVDDDPLVVRLSDLDGQRQRRQRVQDLARVAGSLALDRLGDHLAELDPPVVGGVLRRAAQRTTQPRDVLILVDHLAHQVGLVVHGAQSQLDLAGHLAELLLELVEVGVEQVALDRRLAGHHHAEAHRQHRPVLERLLEHAGVSGHLLTPESQLLVARASLTSAAMPSLVISCSGAPPMPLMRGGSSSALRTP